jgi:hypothetical protein
MTPFQIYKFYLAIKLHFTTEKYDVFKYRGAVHSCNEEGFRSRRGHGRFVQLSHRLQKPQDAVQLFVACFVYDADVFNDSECEEALTRWRKHKEMMTQLILDDLETIELPDCLKGSPCSLQKLVSGNKISIETAVALNKKYGFSAVWKNNFVYKRLGLKIEKLEPFVKFNEVKVFEAISEKENEHQETT